MQKKWYPQLTIYYHKWFCKNVSRGNLHANIKLLRCHLSTSSCSLPETFWNGLFKLVCSRAMKKENPTTSPTCKSFIFRLLFQSWLAIARQGILVFLELEYLYFHLYSLPVLCATHPSLGPEMRFLTDGLGPGPSDLRKHAPLKFSGTSVALVVIQVKKLQPSNCWHWL